MAETRLAQDLACPTARQPSYLPSFPQLSALRGRILARGRVRFCAVRSDTQRGSCSRSPHASFTPGSPALLKEERRLFLGGRRAGSDYRGAQLTGEVTLCAAKVFRVIHRQPNTVNLNHVGTTSGDMARQGGLHGTTPLRRGCSWINLSSPSPPSAGLHCSHLNDYSSLMPDLPGSNFVLHTHWSESLKSKQIWNMFLDAGM